jgi:hypothetical protein
MLKYLTKFTVDILPSVAATVIGAYIVNHYIVTKPDAPAAAATAVSTANPKAIDSKPIDSKPSDKSTQVSSLPEAGVKAKGMSERTLMERSVSERGTVIEKAAEPKSESKSDSKSDSKATDSPAETASIPAEPRRRQTTPREKAVAKVTPAPAAVAPVAPVAPPAVTAPVEAAVVPEERRDANDLARAAIERLRGSGDAAQRPPQEAARIQEAPRVPDAPRVATAPAIRPLPPPIMVSTPTSDTDDQNLRPRPPYAANADDPRRPTPPAEIPPVSRPPLDLHVEAAAEPAREPANIGDEMLSSMKSVFRRPAEVIQSWSKKPLID